MPNGIINLLCRRHSTNHHSPAYFFLLIKMLLKETRHCPNIIIEHEDIFAYRFLYASIPGSCAAKILRVLQQFPIAPCVNTKM